MKRKRLRPALSVVATPLLMLPVASPAATFTPIGGELLASYLWVNDVSADGSVITGSMSTGPSTQAYRWTASSGFVVLGGVPPSQTSIAAALSADGNVIVGYSDGQGFRWTPAGGMIGLGNPGTLSEGATGVSADGNVVAGAVGDSPAIWSNGTWVTLSPLPTGSFNNALAISGDGSVVVGVGNREDEEEGPVREAIHWVNGVPSGLGDLAGGNYFSRAEAASADGRVIVGFSNGEYRIDGAEGGYEIDLAFKWTEAGGMVALDQTPGSCCEPRESRAVDVSADGSVIVGNRYGDGATIWFEGLDGQRLLDVLAAQGTTGLEGWSIAATAISADGRTIVGIGHHDSDENRQLGWVATLNAAVVPAPPSLVLLGSALVAVAIRRNFSG